MNYISEIIKKFSRSENDTGSPEIQIATSSYQINNLARHLKLFKKDHQARKRLLAYVNKRKKLIKYLKKQESFKVKDLIEKLNMTRTKNV